MIRQAFFDELVKLGAVDPEQAYASMERLDALEKAKPTAGQVARYAGLGAVTGPMIGGLGDVIYGNRPFTPAAQFRASGAFGPAARPIEGTLRAIAGRAVTGALASGAVPLVRSYLDRAAEKSKLRQLMEDYQREHMGQEQHTPEAKMGAAHVLPDGSGFFTGTVGKKGKEKDSTFTTSQYSGPTGYGGVTNLESYQGQSPIPSLRAPIVKRGAVMVPKGQTPAARLSLSKNVAFGTRATPPAFPSQSSQSKPFGYGHNLSGTSKVGL